jgi:hypothetical protein
MTYLLFKGGMYKNLWNRTLRYWAAVKSNRAKRIMHTRSTAGDDRVVSRYMTQSTYTHTGTDDVKSRFLLYSQSLCSLPLLYLTGPPGTPRNVKTDAVMHPPSQDSGWAQAYGNLLCCNFICGIHRPLSYKAALTQNILQSASSALSSLPGGF